MNINEEICKKCDYGSISKALFKNGVGRCRGRFYPIVNVEDSFIKELCPYYLEHLIAEKEEINDIKISYEKCKGCYSKKGLSLNIFNKDYESGVILCLEFGEMVSIYHEYDCESRRGE